MRGLELRVEGLGFGDPDFSCRVQGVGCRVYGVW